MHGNEEMVPGLLWLVRERWGNYQLSDSQQKFDVSPDELEAIRKKIAGGGRPSELADFARRITHRHGRALTYKIEVEQMEHLHTHDADVMGALRGHEVLVTIKSTGERYRAKVGMEHVDYESVGNEDEQLPPWNEVKSRASAEFEKTYVITAMERAKGSIGEAARLTGLDRASFRRLLERHGMDAMHLKR